MSPVLPEFPEGFEKTFHLHIKNVSDQCNVYLSPKSDLSVINFLNCTLPHPYHLQHISEAELEKLLNSEIAAKETISDNNESKIVELINKLIRTSLNKRASDIHFEPKAKGMEVRIRIDGILHNEHDITKEEVPEVLSRIKIMSKLDIAEKRRPQDGRIRFSFENRTVDIRVSFIPTEFGEKAVLRLLDKAQLKLDFNELGFTPAQLNLFKKTIRLPNGIILVTGPTGSGKTTTLYAALNYLQSPEVNISTVEDPIEYNLDGINQTQVKPEIKVTFASMLRSFLRQDPNILMVGEIRDTETLQIAIQASLTGHLVFSTIHTNSAVATISRLLDMEAKSLLLASTLKMIVAQRLLRKNCPYCFTHVMQTNNVIILEQLNLKESDKTGHSLGCDKCNQTGYMGRTAVYELLELTDSIKQAITNNESENRLLEIAKNDNFETMLEQAKILITEGITTPAEVMRELQI